MREKRREIDELYRSLRSRRVFLTCILTRWTTQLPSSVFFMYACTYVLCHFPHNVRATDDLLLSGPVPRFRGPKTIFVKISLKKKIKKIWGPF